MDPSLPCAVVTGATSGLGRLAAVALAGRGWHVVLVGRDPARGAEALAQVEAVGTGELEPADLFSLAEVHALGARLRARHPSIGLLINNAGGAFSRTERTVDGLERTVALNVAAPFALTESLLPALSAGPGRVVNVVTGLPTGSTASLDALFGPESTAGMGAYLRAKLALLALTGAQERRYGPRGVHAVALHPGIIPGTRFGHENPKWLMAVGNTLAKLLRFGTPEPEAAERYVRVGTGPVEPGGYYYEGMLRAPPPAADTVFGEAVWARLAALGTGSAR